MEIIAPDKKIGVGVSGGMDSMALLHLLMKIQKDITVINIDHGIRGLQSKKDSDFVEDFCKKNSILCLRYEIDVLSECQKSGESVELCARNLRYKIFNNLLQQKKIDIIALAHHADDNIETVLMRIFRGTGIRGLKGILDSSKFIHPLIKYSKEDIKQYVLENKIEYVSDATNLESNYARNFIRNEILPEIKKKFVGTQSSVLRLIDTAKETDDFINENLLEIKKLGNCLYFDKNEFIKKHSLIQKNSVLKAFEALGIMQDIETRHLEYILSLVQKSNNATLDLPFGIMAIKEYDKIVFMKKQNLKFQAILFDIEGKYVLGSERIEFIEDDKIVKGKSFDKDKIPKGAVVRQREDGDIFKKCNGKTKKLNDYLTDIKMPKRQRDKLLVVAKGKEIFIVVGVEISDKVKIEEKTKKIYTVKKETI